VLRAAGETETTQENIHDWLELDEGDPGFHFLTEKEIAADFFFHEHYLYYYIPIYLFSKIFFCLLGLSVASLIRIIC
jgi:hypothetical protein